MRRFAGHQPKYAQKEDQRARYKRDTAAQIDVKPQQKRGTPAPYRGKATEKGGWGRMRYSRAGGRFGNPST